MRWLIPLLALVAFQLPGRAALDAEAKTPYELRVVVRFSDHPHFTTSFRSQFRKDLQTSLQAALGSLGNVEVLDLRLIDPSKWEPLWKQVEEKGLQSLDTAVELTGVKTHFIHLDYRDAQYELKARQHDGSVGYSTPQIRKGQTRDRGFVFRLASLMIAEDFGLVGTIEPPRLGESLARVAFRGGQLNADLGPWVRKGDIFAVVQISEFSYRIPAKKETKTPAKDVTKIVGGRMEGLLFQLASDPKDGAGGFTMFSRFEDPMPMRGKILGYRCIRLGIGESNLKLQLVDEKGNPHRLGSLQVRVHPERFPDQPTEGEDAPLLNGIFQSKRTFTGMALVRVSIGDRPLARIPIEITGDGVVTRQIRIEIGAESRARLEAARRDAMSRIIDARQIQVQLIRDLTALENDNRKEDALKRGEKVYGSLQTELENFNDELTRIKSRVERDLPGTKDFVKDCETQVAILKDKQVDLLDHLGKLKEAIAQENDPKIIGKRKEIQNNINKAELAAQQANYDDALMHYKAALDAIEEPEAKTKLQATYDGLKKAWEIQDDAHRDARGFIYEVWAKIDSTQTLKDNLAKARQSFEKCRAVGDRLSLNKMRLAAADVLKPLIAEIDKLNQSTDPDAAQSLMALKTVSDELEKLLGELSDAVKGM
jgi:tetratricopeptide (TPR) repeat protein